MQQTLIGALVLATTLLLRNRRERRRVERLAAASLEALLGAIDANDARSGEHARRVARYAIVLASAARLAEREVREVERVALFHDVGKIHAALFDVVHESGHDLSTEERELIATHPARGADVLRPLEPFYPDLADGVLAHHERWDGTGYPRGLAGETIPLTARIVTIADTFDALTAQRHYRDAVTLREARQSIREARGSQFDPRLVDLFLRADVQAQVEEEMRRMAAGHDGEGKRRRRASTERAPDITFRWRDAVSAPLPRDRPRRTPP